jgi:hypothetical protein
MSDHLAYRIDRTQPILGNPDGRIQIVGYGNYSCKYCRTGWQTMKFLLQEYGDDMAYQQRWFRPFLDGWRPATYVRMLTSTHPELSWRLHELFLEPIEPLQKKELITFSWYWSELGSPLISGVYRKWLRGRYYLGEDIIPAVHDLVGSATFDGKGWEDFNNLFDGGYYQTMESVQTAEEFLTRSKVFRWLSDEHYMELGRRAFTLWGLDFDGMCSQSEDDTMSLVYRQSELAEDVLKFEGAPAYVINGVPITGVYPIGELRRLIANITGVSPRDGKKMWSE